MIVIPRTELENNLRSRLSMSIGLDFLELIQRENLSSFTRGVSPIILGGSVRDTLFEQRDPADVDIFFYRNHNFRLTPRETNRMLLELKEDLLLWLDDQGIEYQSLLSERAEEYFHGNRFLDIIDFQWRGAHIQIMIPRNYLNLTDGVKNLLHTMPLISGVGVNLEHVVFTKAFIASNYLRSNNLFPIAHERDLQYLRRKRPNGRYFRIKTVDALIFTALGYLHTHNFRENSNISFDDVGFLDMSTAIRTAVSATFPGLTNFQVGVSVSIYRQVR